MVTKAKKKRKFITKVQGQYLTFANVLTRVADQDPDPDSIGSVDPDPYSESGSGSRSRRAKMTHKSRIFFEKFMF